MSDKHIVVIDIGKTNKKVLVFDSSLKVVASQYRSFEEHVEEDLHLERVDESFEWIKARLSEFGRSFHVGAIAVTTHGATAFCVGEDGSRTVPPVAYTTEAPEGFRREFFRIFGNREGLQQTTATAEIGSLINLGKLLYFAKRRWPNSFAKTRQILNFPQYLGFLLTGAYGAEPTYVGCHTYLYDFQKGDYSSVAEKLGVLPMLPKPIRNSWETLGTLSPEMARQTGLPGDCIVTMGIHDSNSSLLPYLVKGYDDFVLNSTGTWCVAMHPTKEVAFESQELGKLVFYNLDAFYSPVKTSIFMGGLEFETYTAYMDPARESKGFPAFDLQLARKIVTEKNRFIVPSVVKGTGIFPDSLPRIVEADRVVELKNLKAGTDKPDCFSRFEEGYAILNLSLALQTKTALEMAGFRGNGTIFTEGGFRHNDAYNAFLTALYPKATCSLTELREATAFGAAICGKAALENRNPKALAEDFDIATRVVPTVRLDGLSAYAQAFAELAARRG